MDPEATELARKFFQAIRKQIRTSTDNFVEDYAGDLTEVAIHGELDLQKLAQEVLK